MNPSPKLSPQSAASSGSEARPAGTILAIDYGRSRIGLALSDSSTNLPLPLGVLERINRNEDMRRLREVARDHSVKLIVVGLPLRMDGGRGEMAEEAERFAQRVRKQIGVPVEMVDERLTSWEAERILEEEFGRKSKQQPAKKRASDKITVDSVAATIILREFLQRAERQEPEARSR